jgi:hypothetical protein
MVDGGIVLYFGHLYLAVGVIYRSVAIRSIAVSACLSSFYAS